MVNEPLMDVLLNRNCSCTAHTPRNFRSDSCLSLTLFQNCHDQQFSLFFYFLFSSDLNLPPIVVRTLITENSAYLRPLQECIGRFCRERERQREWGKEKKKRQTFQYSISTCHLQRGKARLLRLYV